MLSGNSSYLQWFCVRDAYLRSGVSKAWFLAICEVMCKKYSGAASNLTLANIKIKCTLGNFRNYRRFLTIAHMK